MDKELDCDFFFGTDDTTVKRLDTSLLRTSYDVPNKYIGNSNWFRQPDLANITKNYDVIINDLGIQCISAWWVILLAKFRKQKVYHWDHGWYGRESIIKKWIKRLYFGLSDGSLIYGNYAKNLMVKNGFKKDKLHVIHNSLSYDKQIEIRKSIKPSDIYTNRFKNSNPTIIFIGRLTPVKRLDILINAISELKTRADGHDTRLTAIETLNSEQSTQLQSLTDRVVAVEAHGTAITNLTTAVNKNTETKQIDTINNFFFIKSSLI